MTSLLFYFHLHLRWGHSIVHKLYPGIPDCGNWQCSIQVYVNLQYAHLFLKQDYIMFTSHLHEINFFMYACVCVHCAWEPHWHVTQKSPRIFLNAKHTYSWFLIPVLILKYREYFIIMQLSCGNIKKQGRSSSCIVITLSDVS